MRKIRCAIYTRKSSEDGLEQDFNSLDAQREACEAYITSQKHEGWVALPDAYDDGGLSGGNLERPALQQLLQDIKQSKVDQVVVYKIDRLTRSLADFSKIVDILDAGGASFVSVTQSFNTATSMGRLTLNMLLSFAQFEREVTAERIRDKISASKKKGLWMGGNVPLGYAPDGRSLLIREDEAPVVRQIYNLYQQTGKIRLVKEALDSAGIKTAVRFKADGTQRGDLPFSIGHLHQILTNPIYAGRIRHKTKIWDGQHPAIIDPEIFDAIQADMQNRVNAKRAGRDRSRGGRRTASSPLVGKIFDETGDRLTPSHTQTKKGTRLRYYVSHRLMREPRLKHPDAWRLPAPEFERSVLALIIQHLRKPEVQAKLIKDATATEITTLHDVLGSDAKLDKALLFDAINRIGIAPGEIVIDLSAHVFAQTLEVDPARINVNLITTTSLFRIRRRGVETKLILGADTPEVDHILLKNIGLGMRYFEQVCAGHSYAQIAKAENTSKRMVQHLTDFAFLAPDVVTAIRNGTHPPALTTEWLKRNDLPINWEDQRALLARLQ